MPPYKLDDLLRVMEALRDPEFGCPWDLRQELSSLIPYTLEEAYEVAEAIEQNDLDALPGELGDLLFQVIFYAQIANEQSLFSFDDVVNEIVSKLLRRHPHVFPDGSLASAGTAEAMPDEKTIARNWSRIKDQERDAKKLKHNTQGPAAADSSRLDDIPKALPAVLRAEKLQSRAAQDGFDWQDMQGVLSKLREELAELENAFSDNDSQAMADELGDLMFTCVNAARWLNKSPEHILRAANRKFETRFREVEALQSDSGRAMRELSPEELDTLWQAAKRKLE